MILKHVLYPVALSIGHVHCSVLSCAQWHCVGSGDVYVLYTVPLTRGHVHCSVLSCAQWHCVGSGDMYVLYTVPLTIGHVYYSAVLCSVALYVGTCPIFSGTEYRTCPFLSAVLCSVELCGNMDMCMCYMYIQCH